MLPGRWSLWSMARACAACLLLAVTQTAVAGTVSLSFDDGRVATARFQAGEGDTAVLLLHGFLQTSDFLTVSALRTSLVEEGYTVLAPTLSLGIDRRKASLACEAVHSHTLKLDLAEIDAWVSWLAGRGYRRIVLIGHSHGARELLAYAMARPDAPVQELIAVGLIGAEDRLDRAEHAAQMQRAAARLAADDHGLDDYRLSYCRRYVATADSFASYGRWDSQRVLEALAELGPQVRVILGGRDGRMPPDWPQRLRARGVHVNVVAGAGHFFDSQYELDLLDEVVAALDGADEPPL